MVIGCCLNLHSLGLASEEIESEGDELVVGEVDHGVMEGRKDVCFGFTQEFFGEVCKI